MYKLRPITIDDLDSIQSLARETKAGLTTLPDDRTILKDRINDAVRSFENPSNKPGSDIFFFVLEETSTKKIIGTSAIFSKVGGYEPFWIYKIKSKSFKSEVLNVDKTLDYLQLKKMHNGPTEIGTLFLLPEYRKLNIGRLLSLGRFHFIKQFSQCFEKYIIAELRGKVSSKGESPFWDSIGAHFFDVPFVLADNMVMKDKSFISDLMPRAPIYISLLPQEAQDVIGKVFRETKPAARLLEQEGFEQQDEVDIFEAGPLYKAKTKTIRTIASSKTVVIKNITTECTGDTDYLISKLNQHTSAFNASTGKLDLLSHKSCVIHSNLARMLNVAIGDKILISTLR